MPVDTIQLQTHKWVKECLKRRGKSFSDLARAAGVSTSTIYSVSKGLARSSKLEQLISREIGFEPWQIWKHGPDQRSLTMSSDIKIAGPTQDAAAQSSMS
jgi:lambda repressor-like predicted transcriptional regulator